MQNPETPCFTNFQQEAALVNAVAEAWVLERSGKKKKLQ